MGRPIREALLRSVAIVGSRTPTPHGRAVAARWAAELAGQGFAIVSGGAFGIDAAAHQGALQAGGHTIAVLASGADVNSPRSNRPLLEAIRTGGTVVSELPPGTPPAAHRFLHRNRLIAALAPATLVVQAAARSGALNTAHTAADLQRIVMAVPGPVDESCHAGCHALIREQIAVLVSSPDEILELLAPLTGVQGSSTAR
jgi:DNA processing protein